MQNEQVVPDPAHVQTSTTDFGYTTFPGTCQTKAQEEKVLELAHGSISSEIPLHVAALNKEDGNEDYYVPKLRREGVRRIWQGATVPILLMVVSDPNIYKILEGKTSFLLVQIHPGVGLRFFSSKCSLSFFYLSEFSSAVEWLSVSVPNVGFVPCWFQCQMATLFIS